ncbi:hypothetical protein [Muribaculum sp.]|uniref:hypothetical protein n=1 Tax=Muribaculum sp. TaxID=1918611 RepID=UPI0023C6F84B|nr:hypothetical protein [Muribaculum sp.]MDE5704683.1 hypothetical protein [Muribaculum sp.]
MKQQNDIFSNDDALRSAFHKGLPDAPVTAWFTRKVMNRLPPRRRRLLNGMEWSAYGVAILVLAVYWISWISRIMNKGTVTVGDIGDMAVLLAFTLLPVVAIMAPKVVAWIRE